MFEEKTNVPSRGEVILYNPTEQIRLEVKLEDETVWLTQPQMVQLFDSSKANISEHLTNIYAQEELSREATVRIFRTVRQEGNRNVARNIEYYNLDVIISVGFRVNSKAGIAFRQWANKVLKEYILQGYTINRHLIALQERTDERFQMIEHRLDAQQEQVDFLVRTHKQPTELLFPTGCVFDAWAYVSGHVRGAKQRIILVDNYCDDRVLKLLSKRPPNVVCRIHSHYTDSFKDDIEKHNKQYAPMDFVQLAQRNHDRFLIIDDVAYFLGASLKDMGKSLSVITKMHMSPDMILANIK